jgi:hypothetical protein
MKPHLQAQAAIVRMLFEPDFAASVRQDSARALPSLPAALRQSLAAIDPRALKLDRLIGRRVLRNLFDEYKAATTIYLSRTKKLATLDEFFASEHFDAVLHHARPLAFAYPEFLVSRDPSLRNSVAIEFGLARARRPSDPPRDGRVHLASGVIPIATTRGGLSAMQQAEQYLFEVGLMPAVALCDDAPSLVLDARADDAEPLHLVTVPTETGHSLVTIDRSLYDLMMHLPQLPSPALQSLLDDELAVRT